jgi:glutamyl-tRNA synthetase
MTTNIKVRFAPSPTGFLHVGNCRTALINWLFARHGGGQFLLRLDDTDLERSEERYADGILQDLAWLGLNYDEYQKQSDRFDRYAEVAESLKTKGRLYPCYETPEELEFKRKLQLSRGLPPIYDREGLKLTDQQKQVYEAEGRKPHWRFKLLDQRIVWEDMVRGPAHFEGSHLSDPVLVRADGSPVYTLASVIDDLDMHITHVIRGEDHVTNTAIQIDLLEAISEQTNKIRFGHLSLISDAEGGGLSKRIGSMGVQDLRAEGILPMAVNSLLAKLGSSDAIQSFHSLQELVDSFDIHKFSRGTPKFSFQDLENLNHKILQQLSFNDLKKHTDVGPVDEMFWNAIRGNIQKLSEISHWWDICRGEIQPVVQAEDKEFLKNALKLLPVGPWKENPCEEWIKNIRGANQERKGPQLFRPLRQALTGQDHGPELKLLLELMGPAVAHHRLKQALGLMG